ncbi:SurA N-terminal domain-containing protein [Alkalibacillus salilacus]|uniref:FKBP-type peptidyl-prolyl cis-trans isomerase (Trigger factor) n=1 Tax=Alkalibacillus salilacus TaxID=284582 RepID=A0ABT9VEA1_9BACI|nr:SurA N-terminal domain-containing protein [Alkalibacillus salilacus]MDQ0159273.1 FKBP-type peptidyl-prolyl cis-trans isomerase (trigger factor) [Alkalibacillus salilacus]
MKKTLLLFVLAILASVMVACGGDNNDEGDSGNSGDEGTSEEEGNSEEGGNSEDGSSEESSNGEGDSESSGESVSDVGEDEVVATVGGEDILGSRLLQAEQTLSQQYQMMGQDPSQNAGAIREAAMDQVVNSKVIELAALDAGLEPSEEEVTEEVDSQISTMQEQNELESEDAVYEQLGMSEEEVQDQIRSSMLIQNYLDENMEEPSVSDEDIEQAYEDYKSQMEQANQEAESLENMRSDLESQVKQQKQSEQQQALIDDLKEDTEVNVQI